MPENMDVEPTIEEIKSIVDMTLKNADPEVMGFINKGLTRNTCREMAAYFFRLLLRDNKDLNSERNALIEVYGSYESMGGGDTIISLLRELLTIKVKDLEGLVLQIKTR